MTASLALEVGRAIGGFFGRGAVALGRDTRTSGPMLQAAVTSGLMASGCRVVDVGIAPSPAIQYFVKSNSLRGGVIITASHNPREYNGIKVLDGQGMEASRQDEEAIEAVYTSRDFPIVPWDRVGGVESRGGCNQGYLAGILGRIDADRIRRANLKVVLDCANGAGCLTSPDLLVGLGCQVVTLNAHPDGNFPGHPPEPKEEHLREILELVSDLGADLGAVHDGDADRVVFVDEKGNYVHGDRSLALLAGYAIRRAGGGKVVTPVSSSSCVEDAVKTNGGEVVYTKVGAPLVARRMVEEGAVFGGEENGGLIFPEHQYCRDGAMGLATLLELMATEGEELSTLLSRIPSYHLVKSSVACPHDLGEGVLRELATMFKGRRVETIDGLKIFSEGGWVLIRPSGTEAIFRIFSEARTGGVAEALNEEGAIALRGVIEQLEEDRRRRKGRPARG